MKARNPRASPLFLLLTWVLLAASSLPAQIVTTIAGRIWSFRGDGGPASRAPLGEIAALAIASDGSLFVCDMGNNMVAKISPSAVLTVVAGNGIRAYSGDGGEAGNASLNRPQGIAIDGAGNLYTADRYNYRVRMVTPSGVITTIAGTGLEGFSGDGGPATLARLREPSGLSTDDAGNLYLVDRGNRRVRKIDASGTIRPVAGNGAPDEPCDYCANGDGGPATRASLNGPVGVSLDSAGDLYITDRDNCRIRRIGPDGIIGTLAGSGTCGYSGDSGPASGGNWLSVSPASGQLPAALSIRASAASLALGNYQGAIEVTAPAAAPSRTTIAVTLTVTAAMRPSLRVQPPSLTFQMIAGAAPPLELR